MTKPTNTRIGTNSKGTALELTLLSKVEETEASLSHFSPKEKVEILCILEYILYKRINTENDYFDDKTINFVFNYLDSKRIEDQFAKELDAMNLKTSIDRMLYGKKIAL